jgi:hypothetical protein
MKIAKPAPNNAEISISRFQELPDTEILLENIEKEKAAKYQPDRRERCGYDSVGACRLLASTYAAEVGCRVHCRPPAFRFPTPSKTAKRMNTAWRTAT